MECLRIHHWLRLGEKERREREARERECPFLGMDHSGQNMHTSNYFLHLSFLSLSLSDSVDSAVDSPLPKCTFLALLGPSFCHFFLSFPFSLSLFLNSVAFAKEEKSGSWCTDCTHLRARDNWIARLNDATGSPIFKSRSRLARKEREREMDWDERNGREEKREEKRKRAHSLRERNFYNTCDFQRKNLEHQVRFLFLSLSLSLAHSNCNPLSQVARLFCTFVRVFAIWTKWNPQVLEGNPSLRERERIWEKNQMQSSSSRRESKFEREGENLREEPNAILKF